MQLKDTNYNELVGDILNNNDFNKLKYIKHHGLTRYDHSLRVSYYSYKIAKIFKFNYRDTARAGLLHDFFYEKNATKKEKFLSFFSHPKRALRNTREIFLLNEREENIIESHMFPISIVMPKYKESFLVSTIDKIVASYEFILSYYYDIKFLMNFSLVFLTTKSFYKKNWIFLSN